MGKVKLLAILILAAVVLIFVFQNTQSFESQVPPVPIRLPRLAPVVRRVRGRVHRGRTGRRATGRKARGEKVVSARPSVSLRADPDDWRLWRGIGS